MLEGGVAPTAGMATLSKATLSGTVKRIVPDAEK